MAALSADKNIKRTPLLGDICNMPCKASTQFYTGGLLACAIANGYAIPATDAAGRAFLGIAAGGPEGPDPTVSATGLTPATDGLYTIPTYISGRFVLAASSGAQTDVGKIAFLIDDATIGVAASTHSIPVGIVTRYISSTLLEVDITGFVGLRSIQVFPVGGVGQKMVLGAALFTTTGTTKAVSAAGLTTVNYAFAGYDGTAALDVTKDTPLWFAGAQTVTVGSGNVTVTRGAAGTSGTGFFFQLFGT